jgi:hypothetical protein
MIDCSLFRSKSECEDLSIQPKPQRIGAQVMDPPPPRPTIFRYDKIVAYSVYVPELTQVGCSSLLTVEKREDRPILSAVYPHSAQILHFDPHLGNQ